MKHREFKAICNAVEHGEKLRVEHQVTHRHGRVIACEGSGFEVFTAGGNREMLQYWEGTNCEIE